MENLNLCRCKWVNDTELYRNYHDEEWGVAVHDDQTLFEMLILESFHSGLSWFIILKKRENFRKAFDDFDVEKVAGYDENKIQELLQDAGIVRSRGKIAAAISNAKVFISIQKEFGTFSKYLWSFTDNKVIKNTEEMFDTRTQWSDNLSKDLKKRGMKYLGSVTVQSYLEAVGLIQNHDHSCFKYY